MKSSGKKQNEIKWEPPPQQRGNAANVFLKHGIKSEALKKFTQLCACVHACVHPHEALTPLNDVNVSAPIAIHPSVD